MTRSASFIRCAAGEDIMEERVSAAVEAYDAEFKLWRIAPMGRFIRDPLLSASPGSGPVEPVSILYWDGPPTTGEGALNAVDVFDSYRSRAAMRAALVAAAAKVPRRPPKKKKKRRGARCR